MSIASRIEAIEQHLTDDYFVLTLAGADLTNVNKNIINLKPTWKERLLYFMNNGTQVVWNNWNKVSGTGTTLTLNNTEEAPMSLVYKGNTSQTGTPTPDTPIPVQVVSGDNSIEVCGVNVFDEVIENGYINYQTGQNVAGNNYRRSKNYIKVNPSTTYYLYMGNAPTGAWIGLESYDVNKNWLGHTAASTKNTFTTANNCEYIRFYLNATSYDKICINVNNASINGKYYAYEGASYPINLPVENLNPEGTRQGLYGTSNGAYSNYDSYVTLNDLVPLSYGNTITVSTQNNLTGTFFLLEYDSNKTYLSQYQRIDNTNSATFTIQNTNTRYVVADFYLANVTPEQTGNFQIEKGNKKNSFTPYGTTPIWLGWIGTYQDKTDKSTGINLFDNSNVNIGKTWNNTASAGRSIYYLETEPNKTYTLFAENWNQLFYDIVFLDHIGATSNIYESGWNDPSTTQKLTFTTTTGTNILGIHFKYTSAGNITMTQTMFDNATIGLYEGNISTPKYEPYGTSWYVKKEIGKVVLNGTINDIVTSISLYGTKTNVNASDIRISNIISGNQTLSAYSNKYHVAGTGTWAGFYGNAPDRVLGDMTKNSTGNGIYLSVPLEYNTNDLIKSYLSSITPELYYVLATPTYEYITDTTLIGQLEALKKSYEGQTNISQTNNDLPFELDITALEEMN